jgi:16S rRNA (guanine966-N2)-methyltransferase
VRIIAGSLKRKTLLSVPGLGTRPTSDRLRETLFNILGYDVKNATVLDLYAGTGAMGLEALSRGALFCTFIDNGREALTVIRKNIEACRLNEKSAVYGWDASQNLSRLKTTGHRFDLVFIDPPYHQNLVPPTLVNLVSSGCLAHGARLVIEHAIPDPVTLPSGFFSLTDYRKYGKTAVSFLSYDETPAPP